ncbi:GNAT family N-acetyltransferase [Spiroplasma cantharicola]|uniref:Acetyltransferase, GNAT family protein n=1 Tax=Spiroplasma cantharicola TaxID=362837 RepID=A0A0M4JJ15_9MOLU|nr:GNAT family N-acetyltransferase [Spiroplasma cantharicola]ALD66086.1 acetyltransferase, GNAT family protein [Spiroplasma cantharicola]
MNFLIEYSTENDIFDQAWQIRKKVFCEEQKYPEEDEYDKYDSTSFHVIGFENDLVVCCARILEKEDGWYIGRIAVLKQFRGKGIGHKLINFLEEFIKKNFNATEIFLNAQETVLNLYRKNGFEVISDKFLDGEIWHFKMKKNLKINK